MDVREQRYPAARGSQLSKTLLRARPVVNALGFAAQLCFECGIATFAAFAGFAAGSFVAHDVAMGANSGAIASFMIGLPLLGGPVLAACLAARRAREKPPIGHSVLCGKAGPWVAVVGATFLLHGQLAWAAEEAGARQLRMGSQAGFAYAARAAGDYLGIGVLFGLPGIAMVLYGVTRLTLQVIKRGRQSVG